MKKKLWLMTVLLAIAVILGACSDNNENNENNDTSKVNNENNENNENLVNENEPENVEENNDTNNAENNNPSNDSSSTTDKGDTEDQLDLTVGDTGTFDTTLGTYELTLDKAELIDENIDDIESRLDAFILLDITIKNTSDSTQVIGDLMGPMVVTEDLEGSGYANISGSFDSIEDFIGELEPGEELSGKFLTEVFDADEYYFQKQAGNVAGGGSNQVIWTIKADEAK